MAPIFDYKTLDTSGKNVKGLIEAETAKAARAKLKKSGLVVIEIHEKTTTKNSGSSSLTLFLGRIQPKDVAAMTRQLASLIKANIPLVDALTAIVDQTEHERLKVILSDVRQDVNEGSSLAKACARHPKVFDTIYVNMIEAGESSGTLGLVLLRLADLKEAQLRLKNKVVSAMTYPVLMIAFALILMIGIFTFLIPKLAKIFTQMNKPIPTSTKVIMQISDFLTNWWYLIAIGVFFSWGWFTRWKQSKKGKARWDELKLKAPVFGPLIRTIAITRFANTMATLLGAGVPILTSMNIAKNLVDLTPIENALNEARENISEGQSIADPLRKSGEFPPMMIHMISIGEKTGELHDMLKNVADTYEEQVDNKISAMTSLVEPLMIVGMGIMVGFIVLTVFLPLLDMSNISRKL